jgi:hypothetical protein
MTGEGDAVADGRTHSVGREPELALLRRFLQPTASARALLLAGPPGVGKTTLLDAAIEEARDRGWRVLAARPSDAESHLSFAALGDLLEGFDTETLEILPPPQLRALNIAFLHAEPTGPAPEPGAIALGFLNAVRALAGRGPVLIAIDDIHWLDPASADAVAFAARRLEIDPVRFLLTRRPGRRQILERVFKSRNFERVEVGPLSLGACRRLLVDRLGLRLPRRTMRSVFEAAGEPAVRARDRALGGPARGVGGRRGDPAVR